jgi:hypothetical protein
MQDHMAVKAWSYEAFKQTFDARYDADAAGKSSA